MDGNLAAVCLMVFCLLSVNTVASVDFNIQFCDSSVCNCEPPQSTNPDDLDPNSFAELFQMKTDIDGRSMCFCFCGRTLNEACLSTDECHEGLFCGSGRTAGGPGVCESRCKDPTFKQCDTFEHCTPRSDGSPDCKQVVHDCSSSVYYPVCGQQLAGEEKTFNNKCYMVLQNINLRRADANADQYRFKHRGVCQGRLTGMTGALLYQ